MKGLRRLGLAFALAAMLVPAAGVAQVQPTLKVVPGDSRIDFVSRQMGVPVEGEFRRFEVQVVFDPKKPADASVAVQVDTSSATLGVPMIDSELAKGLWFDAGRYPKADFRSSAVRALGDGRYEVAGRLTLKGHVRDIVLPVSLVRVDRKLVASGSFPLRRLDFDVGDREWRDTSMVADGVEVRFRLTLRANEGP